MKLAENVLIDTYGCKRELETIYSHLEIMAESSDYDYNSFRKLVQHSMGSSLDERYFNQLDWDYVTGHFWRLPQESTRDSFSAADLSEDGGTYLQGGRL